MGFGPSSAVDNESGATIETLVSLDRLMIVTPVPQSSSAPDRATTFTVPVSNESAVNVVVEPIVEFRNPVAFPSSVDQRYHRTVTLQPWESVNQTASRVRLAPDRIQNDGGSTVSLTPDALSDG